MNTTKDIDELAAKEAGLVRREAQRAARELAPLLCEKYDTLVDDGARRAFYEKNQEALKCVGGLLGVCLESGKAFSQRAKQELYSTPTRPVRGMRRWAFDRLNPRDQMAFISAGGRVTDS